MSWIITNRKEAELSGADIEHDRVLLAITPNYVAERYNDYIDQSKPRKNPDDDPWDNLAPEQRQEIIAAADTYCDKHFLAIDDALMDIFAKPERQAANRKTV